MFNQSSQEGHAGNAGNYQTVKLSIGINGINVLSLRTPTPQCRSPDSWRQRMWKSGHVCLSVCLPHPQREINYWTHHINNVIKTAPMSELVKSVSCVCFCLSLFTHQYSLCNTSVHHAVTIECRTKIRPCFLVRVLFHNKLKTGRTMYVYRNNEGSSRNHCCREKATSIIYFCVCVCVWTRVALQIQRATRHHITSSSLSGSNIFFDFIS